MAGRPRSFDRDAALARAMEVFWVKGYADASMADLTSAMGINSPSLYAAFGSKEQLFTEAARLYQETEGACLWQGLETAATAREAIEALLLGTADLQTRPDHPTGCLIVLSGAHPGALPDKACAELKGVRRESLDALIERFRRAQAEGEIAAGADVAAIAAFYSTVHVGMAFRSRDGATAEELRATARAAMTAWDGLAGIAPPLAQA